MRLRDVAEHEFNQWILGYAQNECGSGVRHGQEKRSTRAEKI